MSLTVGQLSKRSRSQRTRRLYIPPPVVSGFVSGTASPKCQIVYGSLGHAFFDIFEFWYEFDYRNRVLNALNSVNRVNDSVDSKCEVKWSDSGVGAIKVKFVLLVNIPEAHSVWPQGLSVNCQNPHFSRKRFHSILLIQEVIEIADPLFRAW